MGEAIHSPATDRLAVTLFLATLLHAAIIFGVSFELTPAPKPEQTQRNLEITVLHNLHRSAPPKQADYLAQVTQQGGGQLPEKAKPTAPEPRPALDPKPTSPGSAAAQPPPQKQQRVVTVDTAEKQRPSATAQTAKPAKRKISLAQILADQEQEVNRLTAELSEKARAYARRPRRKAISASTQEYKYANYLNAWKKKVERIGNLNYPEEAKRKKLHGDLLLHVAVRADGSVERIRLLQSSGHKLLDDAAIRIVKLAAPFAPFPNDIRKETDILDITRTWQFLSNNRLFSER